MEGNSRSNELIVIATDWPGLYGGQPLATGSLLQSCLNVFERIHFVCTSGGTFQDRGEWDKSIINWIHVPTRTESKWLRFLKSLFSSLPASVLRYRRVSGAVLAVISSIIEDCKSNNRKVCMIIDDIPSCCILPEIRKNFPRLEVAIRSENLMVEAFADLARRGSLIERLPWMIEVKRIRRFEKRTCQCADRLWTITRAEADRYEKVHGIRPHGTISVGVDTLRYSQVSPGDLRTVVHVGRIDLRKGKGLNDFIGGAWPKIRQKVPEARLILGGKGTDRFTDQNLGIEGLGFVEDDRKILEQGRIFVNPQTIGAGLQLKSVVSMLAGKALVSTRMGITGIEGIEGEHFLVADTQDEMVDKVVGLMKNTFDSARIGWNARSLAGHIYSQNYVSQEARPLIEEFASLESTKR